MSDLSAGTASLPSSSQGEGWSRNKLICGIAFALAFHVALLFIFGTKKQSHSRPLGKIPHLRLANSASEFIALGDPTLFARPNPHDFVSAFWQRTPPVKPPSFDWTEDPRYLLPVPEDFGADFRAVMQANQPVAFQLDFKPEPASTAPSRAPDAALPGKSMVQFTGELAHRPLLKSSELPSLPWNDVIAPSRVQALVDPAGNVVSAVLLTSDDPLAPNSHLDAADQRALQITRCLRFAPAPRLAFGEIIFTWHTVPTNAP